MVQSLCKPAAANCCAQQEENSNQTKVLKGCLLSCAQVVFSRMSAICSPNMALLQVQHIQHHRHAEELVQDGVAVIAICTTANGNPSQRQPAVLHKNCKCREAILADEGLDLLIFVLRASFLCSFSILHLKYSTMAPQLEGPTPTGDNSSRP